MLIEIYLKGRAEPVLADVETFTVKKNGLGGTFGCQWGDTNAPGARELVHFDSDEVQCIIARHGARPETAA